MLIKFNLTECNANIFVKVDAQIGDECRRTVYLLSARVFLPRALLQKIELSETYGEYSSQYKKWTTLCWMRSNIKELLFIKVIVFLQFSFRKKSQQRKI